MTDSLVTQKNVSDCQRDGVVPIGGFSRKYVDLLRSDIDRDMINPGHEMTSGPRLCKDWFPVPYPAQ